MLSEATILKAVAANCALLRKARRMTLDALAKRSGISKGMLVEIEQGRTNPSIATLCRMANAFGVGIGELLAPQETTERFRVQKPGAGRVLWNTRAGSHARLIDTARFHALSAECWTWRIAGGEHFDGAAHPEGTIEILSVIRGTLNVQAGSETVTARAGSTVRFSAEVPHRYANPAKAACDFQMIVLEPVQ